MVDMKNKISALMLALGVSTVAFAGPDIDTRVKALEQDMHYVKTKTASGTIGAKTALARPENEGEGFFLSFDVLFWQTKLGGTEYAYSSINQGSATFPIDGRMREAEFDWDFGFRFGVGVNFDHGGWDLSANYTYFSTDGDSAVSSGTGATVIPLQSDIFIVEELPFYNADRATTQASVDLDRINLELGRDYYVSHNLSFRPHLGLMTAWINLKQTTRYTGGSVLGVNTIHVRQKDDFWGIGPRTGVNSKWYLTNGFSVFGMASGALVYGFHQTQFKNWYSANVDRRILFRGSMHRFAPTADLQIGLAYDRYIYNDKQHISVSLGYECQYWWALNQNFKLSEQSLPEFVRQNEDLNFHGVDLHIRWDF